MGRGWDSLVPPIGLILRCPPRRASFEAAVAAPQDEGVIGRQGFSARLSAGRMALERNIYRSGLAKFTAKAETRVIA